MNLRKCIDNNHALYEAVFGPHGIGYERNVDIWYTLEQTPPLYSNIVTRSRRWRPDDVFDEINNSLDSWSIKDSFNVLDLSKYGLRKLFDAKWIYLESSKFTPTEKASGLRYEIIETTDAFNKWLPAWDADESLGRRIFKKELIRDIWFIAGYAGDSILSGCIVNPSDDVLGISNFFAPDGSVGYWSDMISFIREAIGLQDIVGYEREAEELFGLGFEPMGDLSVWVKTSPNQER